MGVLTNPQVATLQRILAITNEVLPKLELLEALAQINGSMAQRVKELRTNREYLVQLATAALEIDRQITPGTGGAAGGTGKGKPTDPGMRTSWTDGPTYRPGADPLAPAPPPTGNRYRIDAGGVLTDDQKGWLAARGLTPYFQSGGRTWAFEGTWNDEQDFRREFGRT